MIETTRISHPKERLSSTDVEEFDGLGELASELRSSWAHANEQVRWERPQNP